MLFLKFSDKLEDEERDCAETIFRDHGKRIYEIAFGIVKDRHDAEDVLDSVMLSVMKNIGKFIGAGDKSTMAQLYTYTKNAAINLYNRKKTKSRNEVQISALEEQGVEIVEDDGSFDTEKIVVQSETVRIVRENIALLPDGYEDVLSLYYLYGYTYPEIAEILHISENAVAIRICRAKKKLIETAGDKLYERTEN